MSRIKRFGLAILVPLALQSLASTASATNITSPAGTTYTGAVKAKSSKHVLIQSGTNTYTCAGSQLDWEVKKHGAGIPVEAAVSNFTFEECSEKTTVTVVQKGVFIVHTPPSPPFSNYPITWTGFEITTAQHVLFGTIHCTYKGGPYLIGGITPSALTGQTAAIDIEAMLPWASGSCSKSIKLTAEYSVTSPDYLDVD